MLSSKFIRWIPNPSRLHLIPSRKLVLHEYQVQELMAKDNLPVAMGKVAKYSQIVLNVCSDMQKHADKEKRNNLDFVIKAQIHAGGRGKGHFPKSGLQGGVHIAHSPREAAHLAEKMIGYNLVTKQTPKEGIPCSSVYVVERLFIRRELYLGFLLDRSSGNIIAIASSKGGMSIEDMPSDILMKKAIRLDVGMTRDVAKEITNHLEIEEDNQEICENMIIGLYDFFIKHDATMIEINPLGLTIDHKLLICDSKMNVDPSANFRQKALFDDEDLSQRDPREVEAMSHDLNYVGLDGNIGCMVNGAGLAMATMDLIKAKDGTPANFLDIGGNASQKQVVSAMKIIDNDPKTEAILVNIFAGIARCDQIALGIIQGITILGLKKPIVLRMKGTNYDLAAKLIKDSGFNIFVTQDLEEAAVKAVKMATIVKMAKEMHINVHLSS